MTDSERELKEWWLSAFGVWGGAVFGTVMQILLPLTWWSALILFAVWFALLVITLAIRMQRLMDKGEM